MTNDSGKDQQFKISESGVLGGVKLADGETSFVIPDGVTQIGWSAFKRCASLTDIIIPDGVTSIGPEAFSGCGSLTEITIPFNVRSIGKGAFDGCGSLKGYFAKKYKEPEIKEPGMFELQKNNMEKAEKMSNDVDFKDENDEKETSLFQELRSRPQEMGILEFLKINKEKIEKRAKERHLKEEEKKHKPYIIEAGVLKWVIKQDETIFTVPDGVTAIGDDAFNRCSFAEIIIPDGVTEIGHTAFYLCTSLAKITIPSSVKSIGHMAFYNCKSLTEITLPEGLIGIVQSAFYGCTSLKSITIPASVRRIWNSPFIKCDNLAEIIVSEDNEIYRIIDGALFQKWTRNMVQYPAARKDNHFMIPYRVLNIGGGAFYGCRSLTGITIPDTVTTIEYEAFYLCTSLTEITIPESVKSIGKCAFHGCRSLKSITILNGDTDIEIDSFGSLDPFTDAFLGRVPVDKKGAFSGCGDDLIIYSVAGSRVGEYADQHAIKFEAL